MSVIILPGSQANTIQTNLLKKLFEKKLQAELGFRRGVTKIPFAIRGGQTMTFTRPSLFPSASTPVTPGSTGGIDNGLSVVDFSVEQYTMALFQYMQTTDVDLLADTFTIAESITLKTGNLAEAARRTLDELARNSLYNAYMSGQTFVTTTLGAPGVTVAVDDIRGFQNVLVLGVPTP
ncbi:MAG: DUF4043 domain-containing protein, partial [Pseudomonadota bacterium]